MTPYEVLADALNYFPSPRSEWTEEAIRFAIDTTCVVNPSHGKVDPLRTLRWSEDVMPKLIRWFLVNGIAK